jgi:glutamine amidotransferase
MITIVDFHMGNIRSIQHKLAKHGFTAVLSSDIDAIKKAKILILPGVGNFKKAMQNLQELNLVDVLNTKVLVDKTPIMGICLGAQLFTKHSEEGDVSGLGWIDAATKQFDFSTLKYKLAVPHVGWNTLQIKKEYAPIADVGLNQRFYFTHSYFIECKDNNDILATTNYGHDFVSSLQKDNIFGCQFHPEKSHKSGFELIKNFIRYYSND